MAANTSVKRIVRVANRYRGVLDANRYSVPAVSSPTTIMPTSSSMDLPRYIILRGARIGLSANPMLAQRSVLV